MTISDTRQSFMSHAFENTTPVSLPDNSPLSQAQRTPQGPEELRKAAKQYEAFFISYLLKVMRETVHESGMAGKGGAYFYSFYDQEIGNRAAEAGGIGIARMVEAYIEKNYAPSSQVPPPGLR